MVKRDLRRVAVFIRFEQIELNFRTELHRDACRLCIGNSAAQDRACVAGKRRAVGVADVAEHATDGVAFGAPRKHLEGRGVGEGEHVAFPRAAKALDAAAVEAHAVLEGVLELARDDGERLHVAENIGKPEANEVDIAALDGLEHEILFRIR